VSFRYLGIELEVVFFHDSHVGSGKHTERKTKNLGNIGLDIKADLREFDEENPSRKLVRVRGQLHSYDKRTITKEIQEKIN
jgi:hypothetical protein